MKPYGTVVPTLGTCLILAVYFLSISCMYQDIDRQLAGSLTLTSDWTQLKPSPALRPSRQFQMVVLRFSAPIEPDLKTWGLRLADGTIAIPEVQLIDEYGNSYDLKSPTFIGNTERAFSRLGLPTDRAYTEVRIRSDRPINCEEVIWRCHNMK